MNRSAVSALRDVDVLVFMTEGEKWTRDDEHVAALFASADAALVIAINKIDLLADRTRLLPHLERLQARFPSARLVPVSAGRRENLDRLEHIILDALPESPFYFEADRITDRSERFLAAEIIREKLMRNLGDELPYAVAIRIDRFQATEKLTGIDATIFVEKDGQKRILIGKGGERIKRIATDARLDMEKLLGARVMLNTWVKVKSGWSDDERALASLGYDDV